VLQGGEPQLRQGSPPASIASATILEQASRTAGVVLGYETVKPAQQALLLTARATAHRLLDAAEDLPNAAFEAYVSTGSGQCLALKVVCEDHV
jgi:hypothetical protein